MVKKPRAAAAEDRDHVSVSVQQLRLVQQELEKVSQEVIRLPRGTVYLIREGINVNKEASEEILEIEQKIIERRKPVYTRRNKIISQIPNFWLTIFLNHPTFENLLTEEDEKIFEYLDSINAEDFKDPREGYHITFKFKGNPFFKNRKLCKTVMFSDDGTLRSIGTTIKWKAGKGPSIDKRKGKKRPLSLDSFFSWFSSPREGDDLVAEIIKKEIWPNPIEDFDNLEDDDYDDEDDDDSNDDEEEDGADEGDEDGNAKN